MIEFILVLVLLVLVLLLRATWACYKALESIVEDTTTTSFIAQEWFRQWKNR